MPRRWALLLAVFIADWLAFMPARLGYAPSQTTIGRVLLLSGPALLVSAIGITVARQRGIFSRAELGLGVTEFQRRRGLVGLRGALTLLGLFVLGALSHMLPSMNYSFANGLNYSEFIELVRGNEWRWSFARSPAPVDIGDVALVFTKGVILAPLVEEIPYRALFVPTVLPHLGRVGAAVASGLVFFGVHVLVYGVPMHPSYFLVGAALAAIFLGFGLLGALIFHAGCNFGILGLALVVEYFG